MLFDPAKYRIFLKFLAHKALHQDIRARVDSSDIVQEGLAFAVRDLSDFKGSTENEFREWLSQILRNVILQTVRREHAQSRNPERELRIDRALDESSAAIDQMLLSLALGPESHVANQELAERVMEAITKLSSDEQDVIVMRIFEELTFKEIGARLGIHPGNATLRYQRTIERLKYMFRSKDVEK